MDQRKAHNIAASLILPESVLQGEINLALGLKRTSDLSLAIRTKALAAARKAIEDTLIALIP